MDHDELWKKVLHFGNTFFCKDDDYSIINKIIKPFSIVLTDMYEKPKRYYKDILKPCSIKLLSVDEDGLIHAYQNDIHNEHFLVLPYTPVGIKNPRNHCYLNSILQVLFFIFHNNNDFSGSDVNPGIEGKITSLILDIADNNSLPTPIIQLKNMLGTFNTILDGRCQQDALECFISILDIIHVGSKFALIEDGDLTENNIISIDKTVFSSITSKTYTCLVCSSVSGFGSEHRINMVNIKPKQGTSMSKLLLDSYSVSLHKNCHTCACTTAHIEKLFLYTRLNS